MKACVAVALLLTLTPALALNVKLSTSSSLTFDAEAAKKTPVNKVINLLKDMLKQLEKEGEEDEEVYQKMVCWCKTNDKEKTKSIDDAEARVDELTSTIDELTATSSRLKTEISTLEGEVADNKNALDEATALRQKQNKEFNSEENGLLQSIKSLKDSLTVMSKQHSLLQVGTSHIPESVQNTMTKLALNSQLTDSQREVVSAFVQGGQAYAPQSGEIFGILGQMKENFESNLASSQKEEASNQKSFEEMKAAKSEEIKAGENQLDAKKQEKAEADSKNAQSKEDLKDTKKSLAADQKFLAKLKEKCAESDSEWEDRSKTRGEEMEAVTKATAVLTSDDARDMFGQTFNFMQAESTVHSARRGKAAELLSAVAQKSQNPRLAALAVRVRLDAFTKVKEAIDAMVTELKKEKADETKHKDFCIDEFNSNELQTEKNTKKKADIGAKISDLKLTIKTLSEAIDALKADIAEDEEQVKRATEERQRQHKEFELTVSDQRATVELLTKAVNVLKGFYAKAGAAAFVTYDEEQPAQKTYKKNKAANGVMGMIEQIIADAKAMEAKATHDEKTAEKAFNDFVKDTKAATAAKGKSIVNKSDNRATAESDLVEANENMDGTNTELEQLANYNAELHSSCDFVVKNYEIRQTARDEEIEALKQAKSILSGAKFSAFLQGQV